MVNERDPFAREADAPWEMVYTTEQTFTAADGTFHVVGTFDTFARSKRQAIRCAQVCFQHLIRRGPPGRG